MKSVEPLRERYRLIVHSSGFDLEKSLTGIPGGQQIPCDEPTRRTPDSHFGQRRNSRRNSNVPLPLMV
jgi:hypothetical protein